MSRAKSRDGAGLILPVRALVAGVCLLLPPNGFGREIQLTLLHTSDVQGHVLSLPYREHLEYLGGLLRCASLIRTERAGAENCLLLDSGGFVLGSAESELSGGRLPLQALDYLAYDLRLASEEEWRAGVVRLDPLEPGGRTGVVAGNIEIEGEPVAGFRILDCGGVRVAVAGVSGSSSPGSPQGGATTVRFKAMARILAGIRRAAAEVSVLLVELEDGETSPIAEAMELARRYPDFDVILFSGPGKVLRSAEVDDTLVASAGSKARWLGRVDIGFDTVGRSITRMEGDAIAVDESIPEDRSLRGVLGRDLGRIRHTLEEVIGYTSRSVGTGAPMPSQSPMLHLVHRSLAEEIDFLLVPKLDGGMLAEGVIQYRDIWRAVPDLSDWVDLLITPPELRAILEENLEFLDTAAFLGLFGGDYDASLSSVPGERIRNLCMADGNKPHGRKRLRVRIPLSVVAGAALTGDRPELDRICRLPKSRRTTVDVDTQERVMKYIREHSPIEIRTHRTLSHLSDPT